MLWSDLTPVARRRRLRLVGSQSGPAVSPNRFSVLDSEGHAPHTSVAATTSQDVASAVPVESDSDSQVEVASVGPHHSVLDSGEEDPEVEAEVPISSLAFGAAARAAFGSYGQCGF